MNMSAADEFMQIARNVYSHFGCLPDGRDDSLSQEIFRLRLLYSVTGDVRYIAAIIDKSPTLTRCVRETEQSLIKETFHQKTFVLAGWGTSARLLISDPLKDVPWACVADANAKNIKDCPVEVLTREEAARKYNDALYVIPHSVYSAKIEKELRELGVRNILNMTTLCESRVMQYLDVIPFNPREVFVDGGCFDLSTAIAFRKVSPNSKIYSFEPDESNRLRCIQKARDLFLTGSVTIEDSGLWDSTGTLHFNSTSDAGAKITDSGETEIKTTSLDEYFADKSDKPTFIKMDIEGSELRALEGAKNIIRENKPRLAICIYHKPEDILTLPGYLLELDGSYRFALRHYSLHVTETVLYAW